MTLTATVNSDWQSICGKTLSIQSELTSKLKTVVVDIAYGAEDYDIGGNVIDLSLGGRINTIIACEVLEVSTGHSVQYVAGAGNAATLG